MGIHSDKAVELFSNGFCCAESVLLTIADSQGIDSELLPKIATGFCTGLAKLESLCGAFTGGVLGINLITGRTKPNTNRTDNYELIEEFASYIKKEFGSLQCSDICGHNLSTLQGHEEFQKTNAKTKCNDIVGKSTEYVVELLEEFKEYQQENSTYQE